MQAVCKDLRNKVLLNPQMNTSHVGFSQVSSFVLTEWALSTPSPDWLTASDGLSGVPHVGVFRQALEELFQMYLLHSGTFHQTKMSATMVSH